MDLLLDTHTFIWLVLGDANLSSNAREKIEHPDNKSFISIASLWEMAIKVNIGKLELEKPFSEVLLDVMENGIEILAINFTHTLEYTRLELHHRDPFDRIILAQSIVENMRIVGKDEIFDQYIKNRVW